MISSAENTPAQRRLAVAGFRAGQRRLLRERLALLSRAWARGELLRAPHHLIDVGARIAAYARGQPWGWHR